MSLMGFLRESTSRVHPSNDSVRRPQYTFDHLPIYGGYGNKNVGGLTLD